MRKALILALLAALCAVAVAPASAASHGASRHHRKAAHERHVRKQLLRELRRHPRTIMRKRFLRRAAGAGLSLPLTVRLNPIIATPGGPAQAPSDDLLSLDLGTGVVTPGLTGKFQMI